MSRLAVLALSCVLAASPGCGPSPRELEAAVTCYVEAVQDQNGERWLGCAAPALARELLGSAPPADPAQAAALAGEALVRLDAVYREQRKSGRVEFSAPDGVSLTRLLFLGRGAYYSTLGTELSGDTARLRMDVRLMYRLIDFPRHRRRGETLWRLGRPLGTVYPIIAGMTQMGAREELARVEVDWDLERAPDGGWRVRAARLVPGSAEFRLSGS